MIHCYITGSPPTNGNALREQGAGKAFIQSSRDKDFTPERLLDQGPTLDQYGIINEHYCCCHGDVLCVFCLCWNRKICGIEARRADALRLQVMGNRMRGAA